MSEGLVAAEEVLAFQRDGFVVVRDVLSPTEVRQLRGAIESHATRAKNLGHVLRSNSGEIVPVCDLLGQPGVGWLLSDARLVEIARRLIGRQDLVYFGDSGSMVGGELRGFHKDNAVRDTANDPDWLSPYTLIRMGLYLQDHSRHSGGLKVRRSSHLHADVTSGSIVDVPTRAGDVVVWSLRTTHSGFTVRVRGLPFVHLQPRFEGRLPRWLRTPQPCLRIAAFVTFGTDDAHLRNYVAKHTDMASYANNYLYKQWLYSDGSEATARQLAKAGVTLLRPVPDYGSKFGSQEKLPAGYVDTSSSRPDVYPAKGMEAWIRRGGRILRSVGLA
jgi:hypothetical protein